MKGERAKLDPRDFLTAKSNKSKKEEKKRT
jgi:hypothetical protein